MHPLLIVPGRERSHEVVLAVWAVVIGTAYFFGAPRPTSMVALVGPPWSYIFAAGLVIGGALTLLGSYWLSNVERGLDLERAGLITLTGALVVYVTAVFSAIGWPALMAGGLAAAWMWANVRRSWQITRDIQRLTEATDDGGPDERVG